LANREWSVTELAEFLDLREPTVSHHLAAMKGLGLVNVRAEGNSRIYQLNVKSLEAMSKDVFSQPNLANLVADASEDAFDRKVLKTFVQDGRLTAIPSRLKKRLVTLRWLVNMFERETRYPETKVNDIIREIHPDYAALRRYLVDSQLMARENGIYWRIDE
ncbi:MAG: DUF2087 domain-containing protein, partial [Anaerolineae bacterium]